MATAKTTKKKMATRNTRSTTAASRKPMRNKTAGSRTKRS